MEEAFDARELCLKILSCVYRCQEKCGAYLIADVLCGRKTRDVTKYNLQNLSTFGIVMDLPREAIVAVIFELIPQTLSPVN